MRMLSTSLLALTTAMAAPAWADVTAGDVWANQQALISAAGGTLSGDLADGAVAPQLNFIFPAGAASFQIAVDTITMTDNADGSVTITYPSPMKISLAGGAPGEGTFTAEMTLTHDGYASIATGEPGDISYDTDGTNVRIEFDDLNLDGSTDTDLSGFLTLASLSNNSRITEGNLVTYVTESMTGQSEAEFTFAASGAKSSTRQSTAPTQTNIAMSLPVGGSDIMNLSQAIRDGLTVMATSVGEGTTSTTVTELNGDMLNRQENENGAQTFEFGLSPSGMTLAASAEDLKVLMNDPLIFPADLEFALENMSMNYGLPVNASDEVQDFRVATSLQGLTLGDTIWNLFDPAGQLPRDPAEVTFDITGSGTSGVDLLDFFAMSQLAGPPPVSVDEVTIENMRIAAAGAEATASGNMTFDWTDFSTIPGMPRPEGAVTVNLNGANALMDTLVNMGFIPAEELMMPRMMLGMFATPVGDDMLETVLEVNSEGHVLANGQRLQ